MCKRYTKIVRESCGWVPAKDSIVSTAQADATPLTAIPRPGVVINAITIGEDRLGSLWVGTYGQGLLRFDRRTGQFKSYRHNPADPYSLSNDTVPRLLVDHEGTLWAATWDGLNRFDAVVWALQNL